MAKVGGKEACTNGIARNMATVHKIAHQDESLNPPLTALCPGYEAERWRAHELVDDIMRRHLTSFALSFTEYSSIDGDNAGLMLGKAARAIYSTPKYSRRGELGELLLHATARDFFKSQPAISKIFYKDSKNDTVKGFDCVHILEAGDEIELWIGEVKLYKSAKDAIRDAIKEVEEHLEAGYLRSEFVAVTNKLDDNWKHAETVKQLLDETTSLDEIVDRLVVPVLLTYESPAVNHNTKYDTPYLEELRHEVIEHWETFSKQIPDSIKVKLHVIFVPLKNKTDFVDYFHSKLITYQGI